jgi:hypothetical protein
MKKDFNASSLLLQHNTTKFLLIERQEMHQPIFEILLSFMSFFSALNFR